MRHVRMGRRFGEEAQPHTIIREQTSAATPPPRYAVVDFAGFGEDLWAINRVWFY